MLSVIVLFISLVLSVVLVSGMVKQLNPNVAWKADPGVLWFFVIITCASWCWFYYLTH